MLARVVVVALVALLEQTEHRTAANQTTVAATLSVRLTAGTDTYRVGEHIPIELEFRGTGRAGDRFWIATGDRSGRIHEETYTATPTGVGLDVPAWLRRLEAEVGRVQATQNSLAGLAEGAFRVPRRPVAHEDLLRQLREWDRPALPRGE